MKINLKECSGFCFVWCSPINVSLAHKCIIDIWTGTHRFSSLQRESGNGIMPSGWNESVNRLYNMKYNFSLHILFYFALSSLHLRALGVRFLKFILILFRKKSVYEQVFVKKMINERTNCTMFINTWALKSSFFELKIVEPI